MEADKESLALTAIPAVRVRTTRKQASANEPEQNKIDGALAEWLGSGLQSRARRFDSGRRLDNRTATVSP